MRSGNNLSWVFLAVCLAAAPANAEDLKSMVVAAIKDGKSSGYLDAETAAKFGAQTKSKKPVMITFERIEQYSENCAMIAVMAGQADVRDNAGKPGIFNLMFKLPICTDGSYPTLLQTRDEERHKSVMKDCHQTVHHGAVKDGFVQGEINFSSCPKNGVVDLFYDGTCKELHPGPNAVVKEFIIDEEGALSIKMLIPVACIKKSKPEINKWRLHIFERQQPMYPKELAGIRPVFW